MKKIAVLISTYNGEDYIKDQINSILTQNIDKKKYDLNLFIRDDGSNDCTVTIIKKLKETYPNISFIPFTENLGFAKSFMTLLTKVEADYYFFSDQDDIWEQNKINDFLSIISIKEVKTPICGVFSDAWIADENANSTGVSLLEQRKKQIHNGYLSFMQQIFDTYVAGASLCINKKAREKVLSYDFDVFFNHEAHDYFIALVISCYGKLYFLDKPTLRYRQTGNNVYGARDMRHKTIIQRFNSLYNRVKNVQRVMYTGGIVTSKVHGEKTLSDTLIAISTGKASFYERFIFFKQYQTLVSPRHPAILYWLYTVMMFKGIVY